MSWAKFDIIIVIKKAIIWVIALNLQKTSFSLGDLHINN